MITKEKLAKVRSIRRNWHLDIYAFVFMLIFFDKVESSRKPYFQMYGFCIESENEYMRETLEVKSSIQFVKSATWQLDKF